MKVKASEGEKELMNSFMSRAKFVNTQNGQTQEVPFDQAPDELKSMLKDSFEVPLCKIEVDNNDKEVKRTIVAGAGAKTLVDNGLIANAVLFHPAYFTDKDEWQSDAEISMGNGGFAKGKLTYKKVPGGKGGQAVKVTGTLSNDNFKQPGSPLVIKDVKYVVTGEQTYDPAVKEWVSGKLTIDVSFQIVFEDDTKVSNKGTMVMTLEKLPAKK